MRSTVKTAIEGDSAIIALLTGGVFAEREISRDATAGAFDANDEIKPCALVKVPSDSSDGPIDLAGRLAVDVYLYERDSFTSIDAVLPLLRTLFHRQKIGVSADKVFQMFWTGDIRDQEDGALRSNLHVSSFEIVRNRG